MKQKDYAKYIFMKHLDWIKELSLIRHSICFNYGAKKRLQKVIDEIVEEYK